MLDLLGKARAFAKWKLGSTIFTYFSRIRRPRLPISGETWKYTALGSLLGADLVARSGRAHDLGV